jgi:hypothetical protein
MFPEYPVAPTHELNLLRAACYGVPMLLIRRSFDRQFLPVPIISVRSILRYHIIFLQNTRAMSVLHESEEEHRRLYEEMGYETNQVTSAPTVDPGRRPSRRCSVTEHTIRAQRELLEFVEQAQNDEWIPSQRGFVRYPSASITRHPSRYTRSMAEYRAPPHSICLTGKVQKQQEVLRDLHPFAPHRSTSRGNLVDHSQQHFQEYVGSKK